MSQLAHETPVVDSLDSLNTALERYHDEIVAYRGLVDEAELLEQGRLTKDRFEALNEGLDAQRAVIGRLASLIDDLAEKEGKGKRLRLRRLGGGKNRPPRPVQQRVDGFCIDEELAGRAKRLYENNIMTIGEVSAAIAEPYEKTYLMLIKTGTKFRATGRRAARKQERNMDDNGKESAREEPMRQDGLDQDDDEDEAPPRRNGPGAKLTRREHETADLLVKGLSHEEIGSQLGISVITVRQHIACAARKAQVYGPQALKNALKDKEVAAKLGFTANRKPAAAPVRAHRSAREAPKQPESKKQEFRLAQPTAISYVGSGRFRVQVTYDVAAEDLGQALQSILPVTA